MHRVGIWDFSLLVVVVLQAVILAYVTQPRWKAILSTVPIPFTFAVLAVGQPVDATNILALALFFFYFQEVRWLHTRWKVHIIPAIVLSALTYTVLGALLSPVLPKTDTVFLLTGGVVWLGAVFFLWRMPSRQEPGHKSPLPIYFKLPIVIVVVVFLILIKGLLQGFATVFPMVSIIAAYEARHSLWTVGRQVPMQIIAMAPMIVAIRFVQPIFGIGPALGAGWLVFLCIEVPLAWHLLFKRGGPDAPLPIHI